MTQKELQQRKSTFCHDCPEKPEECGYNPIDCMKEADLYFELYDQKMKKAQLR